MQMLDVRLTCTPNTVTVFTAGNRLFVTDVDPIVAAPLFTQQQKIYPFTKESTMSNDNDAETKDQNRVRAKATGDLDKVTDYVEEPEMDASKMADSMRAVLGSASNARKAAADPSNNVKIQQSDVQLIVDELDIDPKRAERALRQARGDVVRALCSLVH